MRILLISFENEDLRNEHLCKNQRFKSEFFFNKIDVISDSQLSDRFQLSKIRKNADLTRRY